MYATVLQDSVPRLLSHVVVVSYSIIVDSTYHDELIIYVLMPIMIFDTYETTVRYRGIFDVLCHYRTASAAIHSFFYPKDDATSM